MMWSELSGCRSSQLEEEELRSGEPCPSVCPDHFNTQPLLSCLCQDSLTPREGAGFLGQERRARILTAVPTLTPPSKLHCAPVALASAIAQPLYR